MLDDKGCGEVFIESQWKEMYFLLQVIFQGSLLELGGCLVMCCVEQVIWFVDVLLGICLQFVLKLVYDYCIDSMVKQFIVDEGSNVVFDIVYSDA